MNSEAHYRESNVDLQKETELITCMEKEVFIAEADKDDFPEGGRGWLVVIGCFCSSMMTWSMVNAYAAFQTFYETDMFPDVESSKISMIGGCQCLFIYFFAPFMLPVIQALGLRNVITLGVIIILVSLFALSSIQEGELWKCYLFQAVMFPLGSACLFPSVMFSPIEWFKLKRASAMSIALSGVSVGGILWPVLMKKMLPHAGFQWTVRTIAFIDIPLGLGAILLTQQRLPLEFVHKSTTLSNSKFDKQKLGQLPQAIKVLVYSWVFQLSEIKYDVLLIANLLGMFGSYPIMFYLDYFATLIAPSSVIPEYLMVIYNGGSGLGRILSGLLGDQIGRFNAFFILLCMVSISILGLWLPNVHLQLISLHTVSTVVFGLAIPSLYSLFPACFAQTFGTQGSEAKIGMLLLTSAPGSMLGSLIGGSFIPLSSDTQTIIQGFEGLTIFGGTMMLAAAFIVLGVRFWIHRGLFTFV